MTITWWLTTVEPVLTGDLVKNEETFRCCGGRFRFMLVLVQSDGGVLSIVWTGRKCFTLIWFVLAPPEPNFSNVLCFDERLLVEHNTRNQTR